MLKIIICISVIFFSVPAAIAYSAEDNYTPDQKKKIAQLMGIVLVGFSKQDVRDTFSFTEPDIWYTDSGQEAWYYPAPEAQNIYFKDGKVEEIEYTSQKYRDGYPASKKKIEI